MNESYYNDTICAIASAQGMGAIALIRVCGKDAINVCNSFIVPFKKGAVLGDMGSNLLFLSSISDDNGMIDEPLVSLFRAPHSYTGEDMVEISCHGSVYIQERIMKLLVSNGIRIAEPGEFTMRAFLNGKLDLSKAEAVADLIASNSKTSHAVALRQMRGGYSDKIEDLRSRFLDFASLIELELDFSEEDIEFADRSKFFELLGEIRVEVEKLLDSFEKGNVLKNGIFVAIIGKPNVGKSTLLNALLNEERAIVSEIPGTTRDTIEDIVNLRGINIRFIDTAGIRESDDVIENIGIQRTFKALDKASVILYIADISSEQTAEEIRSDLLEIRSKIKDKSKRIIILANKTDLLVEVPKHFQDILSEEIIFISAKRKENINLIVDKLFETIDTESITDETIVTNMRHFDALSRTLDLIVKIKEGMDAGVPTDLIAVDIRAAIQYLGEITGKIYTEEILGNIFSKFCIGK